jgi:hypothetical protein
MRWEPKLIEGTEIIRAFPRPSSRETLNDCSDESSGNTSNVPDGSRLLITEAPSLLKSSATSGRLTRGDRSFLITCGCLSDDEATTSGIGLDDSLCSTVGTGCGAGGACRGSLVANCLFSAGP